MDRKNLEELRKIWGRMGAGLKDFGLTPSAQCGHWREKRKEQKLLAETASRGYMGGGILYLIGDPAIGDVGVGMA